MAGQSERETTGEGARGESGVSRREFLISSGSAAGAVGLAAGSEKARAAGSAPKPAGRMTELGPGAVPVQLMVNHKAQTLSIEPRETLVHVLRERLGLCGTKVGCDRGACGACTVWVDGLPMLSCMTLALDVAGVGRGPAGTPPRDVTTIEGLGKGGKPHPVQQAFVTCDALQCGFCTPGMVMSCAHLYEVKGATSTGKRATMTGDDIRAAVAGNLCRCGSYPHVLDAMLSLNEGGQR